MGASYTPQGRTPDRTPPVRVKQPPKVANPSENGGRPRFKINWDTVDALLRIHCTQAEVAGVLGVSVDTLRAAAYRDLGVAYATYAQSKKQAGQASLRRLQWQTATSGNVAMQIFLGKNYLGQSDKQEITGPGGGALQLETTIDVTRLSDAALAEIAAARVDPGLIEGQAAPAPATAEGGGDAGDMDPAVDLPAPGDTGVDKLDWLAHEGQALDRLIEGEDGDVEGS